MLVFNFFGGPGAGKSTMAARLFADLKMRGHNVELIREYAKDLVWAGDYNTLSMQAHVLGEQYRRQETMAGKVDAIITDSPLLLSRVYHVRFESVCKAADELFARFSNINFMLNRSTRGYNQAGRMQDEEGARSLDKKIRDVVQTCGYTWYEIKIDSVQPTAICSIAESALFRYLEHRDGN